LSEALEQSPLFRYARLLEEGRYLDALRFLASLDAEARGRVLEQYSKLADVDIVEHLFGVAVLAVDGRPVEVLQLVRSISDKASERLAPILPEILYSRAYEAIRRGDWGNLSKLLEEARALSNLVDGKLQQYIAVMEGFSVEDVRRLLDAVKGDRWDEAVELLSSIKARGLEQVLDRFLQATGVDPGEFKKAVIYRFLAEEAERRKPEELADLLKPYSDILPEDVRSQLPILEAYRELARLAGAGDVDGARRVVESAPEEWRGRLADFFIYTVLRKGGVADEVLAKLYELCRSYQGEEKCEGLRVAATADVDFGEVVEQGYEMITSEVLSELREAVSKGDMQAVRRVMEKYGELLKEAEVGGRKLWDVLEGALAYIELKPRLEPVYTFTSQLAERVTEYFTRKAQDPSYKFNIGVLEVERAVKAVDEALSKAEKMKALDGLVVKGVSEFVESLPKLKARLLLALATYYFDRGDRERVASLAEQVAKLDPELSNIATSLEVEVASPDDILCILILEGLVKPGGGPPAPPSPTHPLPI